MTLETFGHFTVDNVQFILFYTWHPAFLITITSLGQGILSFVKALKKLGNDTPGNRVVNKWSANRADMQDHIYLTGGVCSCE